MVEIRKRYAGFSVIFHYYCLPLSILLRRYTNADLKICRYILLHMRQIFGIITSFHFLETRIFDK